MAGLFEKKPPDSQFDLSNTDYESSKIIGTGAYGAVCSAREKRTDRSVAIKKIPNALGVVTVTKRTLREVKILRQFRHENILAVLDMFRAGDDDIYIVFDLMETDLHHVIHSKQPLTDNHIQYFLYQILCGLKYIHSAGVIHRDLKPSNLMVNSDCLLKIGDFGMARCVAHESDARTDAFMTQYVATRWYRAPELLFSVLNYSYQVDIWSVGCILAEMLNRRQLFPGKDPISQLQLIVCFLGTPKPELMNAISSELIKRIIDSLGPKAPLPWQSVVPKAGPHAVGMLASLLRMAPSERLSAAEALQHPYLEVFRNPDCEIVGPTVDLTLDVESLDARQLHQAMINEVATFGRTSDVVVGSQHLQHQHQQQQQQQQQQERQTTTTTSTTTSDVERLQPYGQPTETTDVEMLSARLLDAHVSEQPDPKQLLRERLLNGRSNATPPAMTAQRKHQEREERRRKRAEKHDQTLNGRPDQTDLALETDRSLLEHWKKLEEEAQRDPAVDLEDIIVGALPQPQPDTGNRIDSAEVYTLWREAASIHGINPEDLESELRL